MKQRMQRTTFHRLGRYSVLHMNKDHYSIRALKAVQEFQNTPAKRLVLHFVVYFLVYLVVFGKQQSLLANYMTVSYKSYNKAFRRRILFSILSGPVVSKCALVEIFNMHSFSSRLPA